MAKADKMSKKRVSEIANYLESTFDPTDKTTRGHTKYVSAQLKEAEGLEINFKPTKGAFVKIGGQRISIADLNEDELNTVVAHLDNLKAIGEELGTKSVSSSAKLI